MTSTPSHPDENASSAIVNTLTGGTTAEILDTLQELATQTDVPGLVEPCLGLVQSGDEEVRNWAAEVLGQSLLVSSADQIWLSETVSEVIAAIRGGGLSVDALAMASDRWCWTATLLGRNEPATTSQVETLIALASLACDESLSGDPSLRPQRAQVAERSLSAAEKLASRLPRGAAEISAGPRCELQAIANSANVNERCRRLAKSICPQGSV